MNIENTDNNVLFELTLKLNSDKALHLKLHATLDFEKTVKMIIEWYKDYYDNPSNAKQTLEQINEYESISNNIKQYE